MRTQKQVDAEIRNLRQLRDAKPSRSWTRQGPSELILAERKRQIDLARQELLSGVPDRKFRALTNAGQDVVIKARQWKSGLLSKPPSKELL